MRTCRVCSQPKPLSRYSLRDKGTSKERPRNECKDCLNAGRVKQPGYGKWHKANRAKIQAYMREFDLQRHYGISKAEFEQMLVAQGGGCAICKTTDWPGKGNKPHVDHCHKTGKIRGLLCSRCNVGVGYFEDSQERLQAAVEYLNKQSTAS